MFLNIESVPIKATRIGKRNPGKNCKILVVMNSVVDKITVLKVSKHLKGSNIYIRQDLSPNKWRRRRVMVAEMKRARDDSKRAYTRFSDGNLIVDGSVVGVPCTSDPLSLSQWDICQGAHKNFDSNMSISIWNVNGINF